MTTVQFCIADTFNVFCHLPIVFPYYYFPIQFFIPSIYMTTPPLWSLAKKAHLPAAATPPTLQISIVGHTAALTLNGKGKKNSGVTCSYRYITPAEKPKFSMKKLKAKSALCNDIKDKPLALPHVMNSDRGAKKYCRILIDGKKRSWFVLVSAECVSNQFSNKMSPYFLKCNLDLCPR